MAAAPPTDDPEIALAIAHAPPMARAALAALFALDRRLRAIVARATEPSLALIRLVWWRDALAAIGRAPTPAEPLLAALAAGRLPPDGLAALVEGWEALVDDPAFAPATIAVHASARGSGLFMLAGGVLGADAADTQRLRDTGAAWARVDLVRSGLVQRTGGRAATAAVLTGAGRPDAARWPRTLRPLGQFAMLARRDAGRGLDRLEPAGARVRLARIALFHVVGR